MTTRPGLRERKKTKTRRLLRQEALRLFTEQGYDHTTVEQICDAVEVSPSTFFRYFPAKEDVVLSDDHDPPPQPPTTSRDPSEPLKPLTDVVRATLFDLLEQRISQDRETMLARLRLVSRVQPLRARMWQQQEARIASTAALLAERAGKDPNAYDVRVTAAVLIAVTTETLLYWADHNGEPDLTALFTRALTHLGGLTL
ncbi:TetR family transcriptional regulator [Streptomyces sp. NPDC046931]|uniref:TetR/AcrR family transcriptional regulator n=1 Tax=Streptomyces sp. NPDC046931 TaxID=3154806 RepID=UPI003408924D